MNRFLRYFAEYRAMEAQLRESASARITAEDRVREYRAKCESAESERDKERAENSYLMKALADWQAIGAGHPPIFGVVPIPPPSEDSENMRQSAPMRKSAREVQIAHNKAAFKASLVPVEAEKS